MRDYQDPVNSSKETDKETFLFIDDGGGGMWKVLFRVHAGRVYGPLDCGPD